MSIDINELKALLTCDARDNGCIPFWSWNDKLSIPELIRQIEWMADNGAGGFFMHARGGLKTEYLSEEWMECIKACAKKAAEVKIDAWAYDENGWPSGFAGGKLLDEEENHDLYLSHAYGEKDENAFVSFPSKNGEYLNIYRHVAASTVDILNPEVVDKFISLTHEAYKEYMGEDFPLIKGFFTDEPQYYRWGTPYTVMLEKYFKENFSEDIKEKLNLLFEENEGYREFRYRYYLALHNLMLENFGKKIYHWCEKNNTQFTGHYIEENSLAGQMLCCAGIMPFYEFEHIPGIDRLARFVEGELALRQLSSAAAQTGKRKTITETFGCCGWDITPKEVKAIAEYQFVGGINIMCQHLVPYSEHGQRKRDYPAHYSRVNPWVREGDNFRIFNDYFTRMGKLISESDEIVNVAVLHPIRSAYLEYKRHVNFFDGGNIESIERGLSDTIRLLKEEDILWHFIDETLMEAHGSVEGNKLRCGLCEYDYLILPKGITNVGGNMRNILAEYVNNGGKILALDTPVYCEGREEDFGFIKSNITLADIAAAQTVKTDRRDTKIHYTLRKMKDGKQFIYLMNCDPDHETEVTFTLPEGYTSFESVDVSGFSVETVGTTLNVEPYGARLLFLSDGEVTNKEALPEVTLDAESFEITEFSENYLPVDFLCYSVDGINYSEKLNHIGILKKLLDDRYEGKLWLKYEFDVTAVPERISLIGEEGNIEKVTVNGTPVTFTDTAWEDISFKRADISGLVKQGNNEIISQMDYFQSENVYYALFCPDATESLRNCLAYDCEIEPMYIAGDFGVYSQTGFTQGHREGIFLGDDFVISERKTEITELVTDGYPFFAGKLRLKTVLTLEDKNVSLKLKGRYHAATVFVNGEKAGELLFNDSLDISRFAKEGENVIEIDTVISNRNLFGPHHGAGDEEPFGVGPGNFELSDWKEGKSHRCLTRYSLISAKLFRG